MTPERPRGADAIPQRQAAPEGVPPAVEPSVSHPPGAGALYAALDLGTNSCRMLIAQPKGSQFQVVDSFSKTVQLGVGLEASGRLSRASMGRTIQALRICQKKLERHNVRRMRLVATEACRRATNGPDFIERVRRETGIALDIISAQEEARLAVLGCHALLEEGNGPALIFDIGGGSTELVLVDSSGPVPDILDWKSVPWGVVTLTETERFDPDDSVERAAAYARMRTRVMDGFADFAARLPEGFPPRPPFASPAGSAPEAAAPTANADTPGGGGGAA